jgi:heme/copper-type cytochrome/quinol oxidase subunit 2
LIPALILVIIAIPSFSLLFALDDPIMSSATDYYVVVIGAQWYWIYQFLKAADSESSQGENPLNYLLSVDSDFH